MKRFITFLFLITLFNVPVNAQVFPYLQDFESYASFSPPNDWTNSAAPFNVYPTHGVGNSKALTRQFFSLSLRDSIISPAIGPIAIPSTLFFEYRLVNYIGSTPLAYNIAPGDEINIVILDGVNPPNTVLTINSSNHIDASAFAFQFVDLIPYAGSVINIMISVKSGGGDFFVDIDNFNIDQISGMDEKLEANFLKLYPNPVESELQVSTLMSNTLFIYDNTGKLVRQENINESQKTINVSGLSKGIYSAKFIFENNSSIVRTFNKY